MTRSTAIVTMVIHLLGGLGMLAFCASLYSYAGQRESVGKSLGKIELLQELDKDGIAVPEKYSPRISKADLVGPAIDLQVRMYFLFWPALALQGVVLWNLLSMLPRRGQDTGSRTEGGKNGQPVR